jgi:hypothetical protein
MVQPLEYHNSKLLKYCVILPKVSLYELGCMSLLRVRFLAPSTITGGKGNSSCGYTRHVSNSVNSNVMTTVHIKSLTI